jgi:hypothetical protein
MEGRGGCEEHLCNECTRRGVVIVLFTSKMPKLHCDHISLSSSVLFHSDNNSNQHIYTFTLN